MFRLRGAKRRDRSRKMLGMSMTVAAVADALA